LRCCCLLLLLLLLQGMGMNPMMMNMMGQGMGMPGGVLCHQHQQHALGCWQIGCCRTNMHVPPCMTVKAHSPASACSRSTLVFTCACCETQIAVQEYDLALLLLLLLQA
jgi:hypothetical protein